MAKRSKRSKRRSRQSFRRKVDKRRYRGSDDEDDEDESNYFIKRGIRRQQLQIDEAEAKRKGVTLEEYRTTRQKHEETQRDKIKKQNNVLESVKEGISLNLEQLLESLVRHDKNPDTVLLEGKRTDTNEDVLIGEFQEKDGKYIFSINDRNILKVIQAGAPGLKIQGITFDLESTHS